MEGWQPLVRMFKKSLKKKPFIFLYKITKNCILIFEKSDFQTLWVALFQIQGQVEEIEARWSLCSTFASYVLSSPQ